VANSIAITRGVSPSMSRCELTHLPRQPIDIAVAEAQHLAYETLLSHLGTRVHHLPAEAEFPDSVFVEDAAIVLDEVAVIMRPGAKSRRGETAAIAKALQPFRPLRYVEEPGAIDGGDVLTVGSKVFVGQSTRTSAAAVAQLRRFLQPHGYQVVAVPVRGALHLKSGVTAVTDDALLLNRQWVDAGFFEGFQLIDVDPKEPGGANALRVGDAIVYADGFPKTCQRLAEHGIRPSLVDASELAKAEGALTCCSLIFESEPTRAINKDGSGIPIDFDAEKMNAYFSNKLYRALAASRAERRLIQTGSYKLEQRALG